MSANQPSVAENAVLMAEWDQKKNAAEDLAPERLTQGSPRAAWWLCERGHSWRAAVQKRASGKGCPVCAGKRVLCGFNDLRTAAPEVAKDWHPTLNGSLTPEQVTAGTPRRVWWQCEKGHAWEATVANRVRNRGCPVCAGKKIVEGVNDLAATHPELAGEWHPAKNGTVTPQTVTAGSNQKVWWRCKLGHEWEAQVCSRADGRGCPYCGGKRVLKGFNDLRTVAPAVAVEWHPTLNGGLTPEQVTAGSCKSVWWKCSYEHVWKTRVSFRAGPKQTGCPVCAGKVKQAKQRYYEVLERESAGAGRREQYARAETWTDAL